ncbi:MAG: AI-2E family transporter [Bacteroidales bacterium]
MPENKKVMRIALDVILKLGALFLVVFLCLRILSPFLSILLWGLIIAIIIFPLFERLNKVFGGRSKLASLLLTLGALSLLVLPSIWLVGQLVEGVRYLADNIQSGRLVIPDPSDAVADWPVIGSWLYDNWTRLSSDLGDSLLDHMPQIAAYGERVLGALANTGLGVLQFAASIVLSGIFLLFSKGATDAGIRVFNNVAGDRGEEFFRETLLTIRNVATGVLGVAVIQTTCMGVGLILADIPMAAVWIVIILIMTIAQIPVLLFNIPMIIYLFAFRDPLPAVGWSLYFVLMGLMDNVLKPLIMGHGTNVPMLVIFLGAIGGFMAFGFIGLFLGAIVLALAYKLYVTWVSVEAGDGTD